MKFGRRLIPGASESWGLERGEDLNLVRRLGGEEGEAVVVMGVLWSCYGACGDGI